MTIRTTDRRRYNEPLAGDRLDEICNPDPASDTELRDKDHETVNHVRRFTLNAIALQKKLRGLEATLETTFIDSSITPEKIAYDYREGSTEKERTAKGVVPFKADMSRHSEALSKALSRARKTDNPKKHKVAAGSLGGTNSIIGEGTISENGKKDIETESSKKFEDKQYETAEEFWQAVFPADFAEILSKSIEDGKLYFGFTIAHPVIDGFLREGKYNCPELTDGSVTIEDSLKDYISAQGIIAKEDINVSVNIPVASNDTIPTCLAHFDRFDEYEGKHLWSLIIGTGANAYINGSVTEFGDYCGFKPHYFDTEQPTAEDTVTIDHIVAGGKMGDTFKFAASHFVDANDPVAKEIQKLSNDDATKLVFDLTYGESTNLSENLSMENNSLLKTLAKRFVERSIYYAVNILKGLTMDIEGEIVLFVDGSLLTKNQKYLAKINEELTNSGIELVFSELNMTGDVTDKIKKDTTFAGTIALALAGKLEEEEAEKAA